MKTRVAIACGIVLASSVFAEEAKKPNAPDPFEWSIRVYRFPMDELKTGFVSRERGQLHSPPMPAPKVTAEEVRGFIKDSSDVITQYILLHGVPLPKGSLAVADISSDTLAVRTVNATHDLIASLVDSFQRHRPQYLSFNVQILEADHKTVLQLLKDAPLKAEHQELLARMEALADQGKAKRIGHLRIDTRSGQRATTTRGEQREHATGFVVDERDWVEVSKEKRLVGTTFEIDPVIGPDGHTVDLNFNLEHHVTPPALRWEPGAQSGQRRIETKVTDYHTANVTTAITMLSGMTKLMGIWKVENATEPERADAAQAAFITTSVVPVQPAAGSRAEAMLRAEGEKLEPTPPRAKNLPMEGLPPGMILRRFIVPPDFLTDAASMGPAGSAPDPFAAAAAPTNEPRVMRAVTALDILRSAGVEFPEGSSANFIRATGELVVRNTPKNMESIAAFVDSLLKKVPASIGLSTFVVQADGALLRRLSLQTATIADHQAAWRELEQAVAEGKAKILRSAWIETRSGQRATAKSGSDYMRVGEVSIFNAFGSSIVPQASGTGNDGKATEAAVRVAPSLSGVHPALSAFHEASLTGMSVEVDPVLGPDGRTIDLNMSLHYDYLPPSPHFEADAGAGPNVFRVQSPSTSFHRAELSTALTLTSGMTRMLGDWKPEGSPEFEGDVLQAAFVRADVILTQDEKAEIKK